MPYRTQTPCSYPGCRALAAQGGRCALHPRPAPARRADTRPSASARGYGAEWRKVRDAHLQLHPNCAQCGAPGRHVDHIVSRARGGTDDEANLQTLCDRHHSMKTASTDGGFGNRRR